jgi:hypothetical protein
VLAYPDLSKEFILTTDASKIAVGAILSQIQDGVERPISCRSRQLNKAEINYSASELELLALVWSTKYFRLYLYGKHFRVRTEHAALWYLHKFSDNNSRLLRWSLSLSEFDFSVEHCPGTKIRHVDALSRHFHAVTTEAPLSKDVLRRERRQDPFCKSLRVKTAGERAEYFYDCDDIIYKRQKKGDPLFVVPKRLEQ